MTVQETIRRALRLMLVLAPLTTGGAFLYEREFAKNGIETTGEVIAFHRKKFSSAQEDPMEMEIRFLVEGTPKTFYSSRNVIEQLMGTYKPGDSVPVVYNADRYPHTKIGHPQHLYATTLTFLILWLLFIVALTIAWFKNREHPRNRPLR